MKKVASIWIAALFLSGGVVTAQNQIDAYKLSGTDNNGTARYLGMGGAFGALGGDVSSMHTNPAGLGIYRSSEIVTSVSLNMAKAKSDWNGFKSDANKTTFNLDNFAYVGYFPTGNTEGIIGWNFGFSYNRLMNFNRTYRLSGSPAAWGGASISDYMAELAYGRSGLGRDDAYNQGGWLPVLGYQSGMIESLGTDNGNPTYHSTFSSLRNNEWEYVGVAQTDLEVREKGSVDQYNFSFATNISDIFFIGANFAVTDINYRMTSLYDEFFESNAGDLYLDNYLSTDGTGYGFNIGAIVRPADFLRLGFAYTSPTWYKMTDYFSGEAGTYNTLYDDGPVEIDERTDPYSYANYKLRTPDKFIFSVAGILGTSGLISVDYELTNYKNMRLFEEDGYESNYFRTQNNLIREDYQLAHMVKVGGEYKVTPQFAIRAGYTWQSPATQFHLRDGAEVEPAGTIAHYTVDKGSSSYSAGFGYRFTPRFYMDMAYVFRQHKENAFTFSNLYYDDGEMLLDSPPASLKTNMSRVALTLGYKF